MTAKGSPATHHALATAVATYVVSVLPLFMAGSLAVGIREDLALSAAQVGTALGLFTAVAGLASTPAGRWVDRVGWERGVLASTLICAGATMAIPLLAHSFLALVVLLSVAGFGFALAGPATNVALAGSDTTMGQGLAFGIKQAAAPLATMLAGLAVPLVAVHFGWRVTFALAATLPVGALVLARHSHRAREHRQPRARVAMPRWSWTPLLLLTVSGALASAAVASLSGFTVLAGVDAGMSEGGAGTLLATGALCGIGVRLVLGHRVDRTGARPLPGAVALMALGAGGCLLMSMHQPSPVIIGALVAHALGWGWPGLYQYAIVASFRAAPAAASGVAATGLGLGGTLGPIAFGIAVQKASYTVGWTGVAAALFLAAVAAHRAERHLAGIIPEPVPGS